MHIVTTGIDGVSLSFSILESIEKIIPILFPEITFDMFSKGKSKLKAYRNCYSLKTTSNNTLVQVHTGAYSHFGHRNLLQIKGLTFSDSALNALRPFDLNRLLYVAKRFQANITKIDPYIDVVGGNIPIDQINEMTLPHNFDQFIQSPFLKVQKGILPEPRRVNGTVYIGQSGGNVCEIVSYSKGLSPRQRVHTRENPLKYTWHRFELRFANSTSKRIGQLLFDELRDGSNLNTCIAALFRRYLRFVEPSETNKRKSSWPLQKWYADLLNQAAQLESVTFTGEVPL